MPLIVPSFGGIHIPTCDRANKRARFLLENNYKEPTRLRRAERRVMSQSRFFLQRRYCKYLFSLLRVDAVPKRKMQNVAVVPIEIANVHEAARVIH